MHSFVDNFENSDRLRQRSRYLIPAVHIPMPRVTTSTLSCLPASLKGDNGCHVWDVDGNENIEYGMGNRAVV